MLKNKNYSHDCSYSFLFFSFLVFSFILFSHSFWFYHFLIGYYVLRLGSWILVLFNPNQRTLPGCKSVPHFIHVPFQGTNWLPDLRRSHFISVSAKSIPFFRKNNGDKIKARRIRLCGVARVFAALAICDHVQGQ